MVDKRILLLLLLCCHSAEVQEQTAAEVQEQTVDLRINKQEMGFPVLLGFIMMAVIEGGLIYWKLGSWILNPNQPNEPKPSAYLQLVIFSLAGMIATGGVLTRLYADLPPEDETPLFHWYGYNNICIVFDYYPSNFVMPSYFNLVSMFALQFAIKDTKRMLDNPSLAPNTKNFGRVLNISFVLITVFFSTCLAIGPMTNMYIHTVPFLMMICVYPLIYVVHWMGAPEEYKVPAWKTAGIALLCILSWTKGSCTLIALTNSAVPSAIGQAIDKGWTLFFMTSPFLLFIPYDEKEKSEGQEGLLA